MFHVRFIYGCYTFAARSGQFVRTRDHCYVRIHILYIFWHTKFHERYNAIQNRSNHASIVSVDRFVSFLGRWKSKMIVETQKRACSRFHNDKRFAFGRLYVCVCMNKFAICVSSGSASELHLAFGRILFERNVVFGQSQWPYSHSSIIPYTYYVSHTHTHIYTIHLYTYSVHNTALYARDMCIIWQKKIFCVDVDRVISQSWNS